MSGKKYKQGDAIWSLRELDKQEFIFFNGKVYHRGWWQSWQYRTLRDYLDSGRLFRAYVVYENSDDILEKLWDVFEDVPMNPDTECIESDFMHFEAGTHREEIWHWFDERHSKGVHFLLYGE